MFSSSSFLRVASSLSIGLFLAGCGSPPNGTSGGSANQRREEQRANLAKLSPDDRSLAEAQGYCAVSGEPLGSMGPPIKVIVKDQPVFVCCQGCERKASSHPDQTLAKVAEFKAKVKTEAAR